MEQVCWSHKHLKYLSFEKRMITVIGRILFTLKTIFLYYITLLTLMVFGIFQCTFCQNEVFYHENKIIVWY